MVGVGLSPTPTITIPNHPPNPTDVWIAGILNEYHHEFGQWR